MWMTIGLFIALIILASQLWLSPGVKPPDIPTKQYPGQVFIEYGDGSRERFESSINFATSGTFLYSSAAFLFQNSEGEFGYFTIYKATDSYIISLHGDYTLRPLGDNKYEVRKGE